MDDAWSLSFEGWKPAEERRREALCALGNGAMAARGALEERGMTEPSYPATYVAGAYDRLSSEVDGQAIEHTDLVRWPSWLSLAIRRADGEWLDPAKHEAVEHVRRLDLRRGVLERRSRIRDGRGRTTRIVSLRLVSMADPHLAAIRWEVTAEDWEGDAEIRTAIDGDVANTLVERGRAYRSEHVRVDETWASGEDIGLACETIGTRVRLGMVARTRAKTQERIDACDATSAVQCLRISLRRGEPFVVEKVVAVCSSRDPAVGEPHRAARERIARAPSFDRLLGDHERAWELLWRRGDVQVEGKELDRTQAALRLHAFHILSTASPHLEARDAGFPARGLSEGYRGHVFWDELFVLPYLCASMPDVARCLLVYRRRRLDEARARARSAGGEGAMFPWESAIDGREETPPVVFDPRSDRYVLLHTHLERHVSAAVAYNVWRYYETTMDFELLSSWGAEMIVEVARSLAGLMEWDARIERFRIAGVVGPDEYHTLDPDTGEPGLRDNAYTNVMAAWSLRCAQRALEALPAARRREIEETLGLSAEDLAKWDAMARRIYVPHLEDGLIAQFAGWDALEELDWTRLAAEHGDLQRLDDILRSEGDDVNRYKAAKQADVLMLFYLFPLPELQALLGDAGYRLDVDDVRRNVQYYRQRTAHGSTLSRVVHSWVLARLDRGRAWDSYENTLRTDLEDLQGGTTEQGLHLGAMAGTIDLMQRCYAGVEPRCEALYLRPRLPESVDRVTFSVHYHGHVVRVVVERSTATVEVEEAERDPRPPLRIGFQGEIHEVRHGRALRLTRKGDE